MISNIVTFAERLRSLDPTEDDFVRQADSLIEELDPGLGAAVAPAIFAYFEAHPKSDMGAPGTLVHYLEAFYPDYVGEMMESLQRQPSYNAVLMTNRILNSPDYPADRKTELMRALQRVVQSSSDDEIRDLAERYYLRHSSAV